MQRSNCDETVNNIINDYLKRNCVYSKGAPWVISKSNLDGFGVFAQRDIQPGEVIFKDHPVIIGPRIVQTSPICATCFGNTNLKQCTNNCGLTVCSLGCQNSSSHIKECKVIRQWQQGGYDDEASCKLQKCLAPIQSLLLSEEDKQIVRNLKSHPDDKHGYEVDILKNDLAFNIKEDEEFFMRFVCSVLDSNAFEVIVGRDENRSSLRGVYPLSSLTNHSCVPNTSHVFDKDRRMVIRAAVFIRSGEEIFHSYSRVIWGTTTRRYHLFKTKHFLCSCPRCSDPTEFGTYMSSILCKNCKGNVVPINPLMVSKWKCEACGNLVSQKHVWEVMSVLSSTLTCFDGDSFELICKFLKEKLIHLVPRFNQIAMEIKYKVIWIIGHAKGFSWSELSMDLLVLKEDYCRELLHLLDNLKMGQCKMRGLLLYELYKTLKEMRNRSNKLNQVTESDMKQSLDEAAYILMYDVSASTEIQQKWEELK